ncbi:vWA domain-containing protein [Nesterenkonia ebinurensis]|uniref:vWA domain-containing protein n=1 Tax=Nesterenkonia ebinurensis TaxID=2608252 RepID=UPI00168B63EA|nr:VWA domain-containing protein [Nesterenkonia ebinurensis]
MKQHSTPPHHSPTRTLRALLGTALAALMVATVAPTAQADLTAAALPLSSQDNDGADSTEDDAQDTEDSDLPEPDYEEAELLLVMDASGSMRHDDAGGQTRIAAAKDALTDVVDSLEDHEQVGLRIFSGDITDSSLPEACEDTHLAVEIGTDNRDELSGAIDEYDAIGAMTPIAYALEQAAEDFSGESARTIVLVSDGEENCNPDPCEAAQAIAEQGIDLQIHTVGFNIDQQDSDAANAREQLQCIADAGGGDYYDATDAETLTIVLERLSLRAFEPFQLEGERVEGATEISGDLPELTSGAQYLDTIHGDGRFYRIPRTVEGSTIHVGVTTLRDLSSDRAFTHITPRLGTPDWTGDEFDSCEYTYLTETSASRATLVRTGGMTSVPDPGGTHEDCGNTDELILAVEMQEEDESYEGKPFEIVVWEEPPAENSEELPERYSGAIGEIDIDWQEMEVDRESAEEILGGNSFNNAVAIEPGTTYAGTSLLGESQVFRVPVEWGEHLQVELVFPEEPNVPIPPHIGASDLQVISPYRADVVPNPTTRDHDHTYYGISFGTGGEQTAQVQTYPVQYNNRTPNNYSRTELGNTTVAGDYYVVVNVGEYSDPNTSALLPFYLHVETVSDGTDAEPVYAEPASAEDEETQDITEEEDAALEEEDEDDDADSPEAGRDSAAGTDETEEEDEPVAAEQTGAFSGTTGLLLGLAALGLLLLAGGGVVLARAMKKS